MLAPSVSQPSVSVHCCCSNSNHLLFLTYSVIIPGIYGMHKLIRWVLKHRALRRRHKGGRLSQDLIEEAEEELD